MSRAQTTDGGVSGVSGYKDLSETVWGFISVASEHIARMEETRFGQEMQSDCLDLGMESPIEHLFWVACVALCRSQFVNVNPEPAHSKSGELVLGRGIHITPQARIGKYRVDFLIEQVGIGPAGVLTPIVVELDGHDFHDKDKRQRSYEKARDRALVRAGHRVLHFTGSDVVRDPFACAYEALEMVGVYSGTGIGEYNPRDPMAMGE